ncbi:MAG: glucosaminidase domain-containing protein [Acidimicrobiales bacterium]
MSPLRRSTVQIQALSLAVVSAIVVAAVGLGTVGVGTVPAFAAGTTTTTAPKAPSATTTTLVPISIPQHGGGGPNPPPSSAGSTTTVPAPIIPVPASTITALVRSVQDGLAQLEAINAYDQAKGIDTVDLANAATAHINAQAAQQAEDQQAALVAQDQTSYTDYKNALSSLAVALYVRSDVGAAAQNADAANPDTLNKSVLLAILINHGQDDYEQAKRQLQADSAVLTEDKQRAEIARVAEAEAEATVSNEGTKLDDSKLAAVGQKLAAITGTVLPTIMGPSAISADELTAWYAHTGYLANTTVPMAKLASFYVSEGAASGLRADIAFAQSIVETGYFTFPSGGQVFGGDNNFAGIGACDSCAHGWRFPNAETGVAAQLQLLQAYATTKSIPTPLVGRVGVAGCCQTWLALSGVWATNPNYGYEILSVYQEILDFVIPVRLAASGI